MALKRSSSGDSSSGGKRFFSFFAGPYDDSGHDGLSALKSKSLVMVSRL